jgi:hypothetical protein
VGKGYKRLKAQRTGAWSFAEDRQLIQLALSSKSLETIAAKMQRSADSVAAKAHKLGISLQSRAKTWESKFNIVSRAALSPRAELPDNTQIADIQFSTRISFDLWC